MNRSQKVNHILLSLFIVLACISLPAKLTAQTARTLPWYEAFDYPEGVLSPTDTPNVSSDAWNLHGSGDEGAPLVSVLGAMTYSGLQFDNRQTGLVIGATASNRNRGALINTTSSGSLYASFLLNVQAKPSANRIVASLSSVSSGSSPGGSSHCIWLNPSGQLLVSKRSTSGPSSAATPVLTSGTHLVVLGYTWNPNSQDDTVQLWLDPDKSTFGSSAPAATISNTTATSDSATLASFWLPHVASIPAAYFVDELRIAASWAEALPAGPTPAASSLVFTTNPNPAAANSPIGTVAVQVYDQYGYPFAVGGRSVSLTVNSGSLSGTTTQTTDGNGKATFPGLSVSSAGHKQLFASSPSPTPLTSGESFYFTVLSGGGGSPPKINQSFRSGNSIVLRGVSGDANQSYSVLTSTNLNAQKTSWATIGSSSFANDGSFSITNTVFGNAPVQFFAINSFSSGGGGAAPAFPKMGWVNSNNVTGGAGGPVVIVSNYNTLDALCQYSGPVTIYIKGAITNLALDAYLNMFGANKSILGYSPDSALYGCDLRINNTNVIVRNLYFHTTPYGSNDCITIDGGGDGTGGNVWVDHCTFYNGQDGSVDITKGADYVTVSWCKFHYGILDNPKTTHRLVNLIGSSDSDSGVNFHVTFHHNWYSTNCMERMPSVRFGRVHCFNNYYKPETTNLYCMRTRINAEVLSENNYFDHVQNAMERLVTTGTPGKLFASGNILDGCTTDTSYDPGVAGAVIQIPAGNDVLTELNPPPYWYTLDPAATVPTKVSTYSGQAGAVFGSN